MGYPEMPNVNISTECKQRDIQYCSEVQWCNTSPVLRKKSETQKCEREMILRLHRDGKSYKEIADIVKRSKSTMHYVIKMMKNEGTIVNKTRSGRPRKLTKREEKAIIREIKNNPATSAPKLANMIEEQFGKQVHPQLCRRVLRENNFHGRVPRRKPYISKVNRRKRLQFAKNYINKENSFWDNAIFSEESKFNVFNSDGQNYVWRQPNTELQKTSD